MKPELVLKKLKKIDEPTLKGLVEIYENHIAHEEVCGSCKKSGSVVCKDRPTLASDFDLNSPYTIGLITWINSHDEDLDAFLEKKRQFGGG